MDKKMDSIWQERADYVDVLLHLKHKTFEMKNNSNSAPQNIENVINQVGIKRALVNSLRKRVSNPKVYYNPFIQSLLRIKKKLGI